MAWTAPLDWTGITNNIVTAAQLNQQVRDNMNVLSTHAHSGAAGMGSSTLSAVTLASIVNATFADQSANPDAAGELQRNGNNLLWYGSSAVNITQADAAAGTASLRTLGTGATTAAAGNHTHTITVEATTTKDFSDRGYASSIGTDSATDVDIVTQTHTGDNTANAVLVQGVLNASYAGDVLLKVWAASSVLESRTLTGESGATTGGRPVILSGIYQLPSTSSITYKVTGSPANATANNAALWAGIRITELTILP